MSSSLYFKAGQLFLALLEALAEVLALQPVPLHAARQLLVAVADLVGEALRGAAPDRAASRFSEKIDGRLRELRDGRNIWIIKSLTTVLS